jgi:hypothetical protein
VRADSRQDFYAKSLALLGLGVLAGAGALVDYWPAAIEPPRVATALRAPAPARMIGRPGGAASLGVPAALPAVRLASARRAITVFPPRSVHVRSEALALSTVVEHPVAATTGTAALSADAVHDRSATPSTTLIPEAAPASDLTTIGAVAVANSGAPEPSVSASESSSGVVSDGRLLTDESRAASNPGAQDGGFISGAMKKTGVSILKGSTKTGTSIVGAFRALGGAVRKAFPG